MLGVTGCPGWGCARCWDRTVTKTRAFLVALCLGVIGLGRAGLQSAGRHSDGSQHTGSQHRSLPSGGETQGSDRVGPAGIWEEPSCRGGQHSPLWPRPASLLPQGLSPEARPPSLPALAVPLAVWVGPSIKIGSNSTLSTHPISLTVLDCLPGSDSSCVMCCPWGVMS